VYPIVGTPTLHPGFLPQEGEVPDSRSLSGTQQVWTNRAHSKGIELLTATRTISKLSGSVSEAKPKIDVVTPKYPIVISRAKFLSGTVHVRY
jgi:hypothetical protein